jgi:SET domain-containing protein
VIEYTGRPLGEEEKFTSRSKYLFDLENGVTIDGAVRTNKARYINHSCRPNCEADVHKGHVWIHATRAIKPGEELSYDYGETYFNAYLAGKCRCLKCAAKAEAEAVRVLQAAE